MFYQLFFVDNVNNLKLLYDFLLKYVQILYF